MEIMTHTALRQIAPVGCGTERQSTTTVPSKTFPQSSGKAIVDWRGDQMGKYKIEKGIPIPGVKYPFDLMGVGDSFFVADENERGLVSTMASRTGKKLGMKFSVKKQTGGGFRVWRTA